MKKTFTLEHPKIKAPRIVDSIKHEIKKHLKKERQKPLPPNTTYWGFSCRVGQYEETAIEVHLSQLNKNIDSLAENNASHIFVEIKANAIKANKQTSIQED